MSILRNKDFMPSFCCSTKFLNLLDGIREFKITAICSKTFSRTLFTIATLISFYPEPSSQLLRKKFLNKDVCLSPNPFEYLLLADKQRLIDWVSPGFLEGQGFSGTELGLLKQSLPFSYDLCPSKADEVWAKRKHFSSNQKTLMVLSILTEAPPSAAKRLRIF